jgi:hypothetical protein
VSTIHINSTITPSPSHSNFAGAAGYLISEPNGEVQDTILLVQTLLLFPYLRIATHGLPSLTA